MKMKRWTRRLALLLVAVLMISCLPLAALAADEPTQYVLDTDGTIDNVPYIIYDQKANRVMHNNTNKGTTDNCTPTMNGTTMIANHATGNVWTPTDDLWRFVEQEDGSYFIQSVTDGKYLTATVSSNQLALSDAGVPFTITHQGQGVYYIQNGGKYLAFGNWKMQDAPFEIRLFGEKSTTTTDPVEPTDPPTPPEDDKPTTKPAVGNSTLYQVDILCQKHVDGDPDCTNHWWSQAETAAAFTVGDIQANTTGYQEDTCKWVCPVTPAHDLDYYLNQLNTKTGVTHTMVTTALPTAWFFWDGESWTLPNAEVNSGVRFNGNVGSLSLYATCGEGGEEPDPGPVDPDPVDPDKPTKPTIDAERDLYQVEIMCEVDHAHYWTYPSTVDWAHSSPDQFTVGDVRANDLNNGTAEEYPYICPVTPAYTLTECVAKVDAVSPGHRAVTTEATIPVAYYYWNATDGWTLLRGETANPNVRFSSGQFQEGTLEIKVTCAADPGPVDPDPPTPVDPNKPAAPANQPEEGTYTIPSDTLSGTGSSEPMSDADVNSYFRIPALVTLPNGWLVAAADARWTNTNDSPNNLDTIVSVSKDGGETWDWEIVNYFADFAPLQGPTYYGNSTSGSAWPSKTASASFIDPALTVDGSGKLWMLVDMLPSYGGNAGGHKTIVSTGFDDQGRLLISHGTAGGNASGNAADYTYCVDLNATPTKTAQKNGKSVGLYPIQARSGGAETGYYVDIFMDLWYDYENNGGMKPVLCRQTESEHYVQNNIFYQQSEWKVICTFYIMARSATVDEQSGRLVWSDPKLLNVKNTDERFTAVCPGRGTTTTVNGKERLIFQVYDSGTGSEQASTVYSDDGGLTWTRGARTAASDTAGKASESQIVHLPNGDLRMYSRNDKNYIRYADSTDGGRTWGTAKLDENLAYCGNDMVSFINVDGVLVGPDNETYENLILASYARGIIGGTGQNRNNGVIRIGYFNDDAGQTVTWLNDDTVRFSGRYNYSCLTQLPNNEGFAVLYEQDDTSNPAKGVMAMHFVMLTAADLLGEGWTLTTPAVPVTVKVDSTFVELTVGGSRTVNVEYTPADAQVTWTSADPTVAAVENGVITAVGAGKTTVTVSVKGALTRTARIAVVVQPESGELILPDQYMDSITTKVTPGTSGYLLTETEPLADGNYVIYADNGAESRVMHNSGTRTDHYRVTVDGKTMTGVTPANHEWTFTKTDEGYTIRSAGDKYLSTNAVQGKQLELKDESTLFSVAYQGEGVWHIKNGDKYLGFTISNGWMMQSGPDTTLKLFSAFTTQDTTTYTVSADGLTALIQAAEADRAEYDDVLALAKEYDNEAAAQEALDAITAAAKEVYSQLREGNITRYLVTYTVQDELLAVQSYAPGETIVPMTDPVRAGFIFTGWTGMPTDKVMPEHDLALVAAFRPVSTGGGSTGGGSTGGGSYRPITPPADEELNDPDVPLAGAPISFVDVAENAWYAKAVAAVAAQGLVKGVGENKFAPTADMTRSSLAEVIYRLAGSEEKGTSTFTDVAGDAWYANAVAWAAKNGVVTGVTDDVFAPDRVITRQELAVMLCRYAKLAGLDTASDAKALETFSDGDTTGDWAVEGMAWCVANGILEGKGGSVLDPTANITRAEVAAMLDRFTALLK